MPIYEYKCNKCGKVFEKLQEINADTFFTCPVCNEKAERIISTGVGLIFKGSGFYITDYKNKKSFQDKKEKIKKTDSTKNKEKKTDTSSSENKTEVKSKDKILNSKS